MTQIEQAWGAGPSTRYEALAEPFRPIFKRIRAAAVERDINHHLPADQIAELKAAGFSRLRLPVEHGGFGATLPELFNLIIELSEADSNVTNTLRAHFGFTEDVLNSKFPEYRAAWLKRIGNNETVGSGFSESGDAKVGSFATRLVREGDHLVLNGQKYYTSGSLFADWINVGAVNENEDLVVAVVPTRAEGVRIVDDWGGFGQSLTASGTATFTNVVVGADVITPDKERFRYATAFYQLVHLATLAGIARAAAGDVSRLVAERRRIYSHGNASRVAEDPQILQIVGKVRGQAYAAGAVALKAAEALQRAYEAIVARDIEAEDAAIVQGDIEVNQAVSVITSLVLDATTVLFDALGSSAAKKGNGLDRYWRNARTISSHNPRVYRERIVGDFAVNGTKPEPRYRVGLG